LATVGGDSRSAGTAGAVLASVGAVLVSAGAVLASAGAVLASVGAVLASVGAVLVSVGAVLVSVGAVLASVGAVFVSVGAVLVSAGAGAEPRERGGAKKSARLGRPVSFGEDPSPSCVLLESDPLMALSVLPCVLMGCPTTGRP
jgi:hypothetical protein